MAERTIVVGVASGVGPQNLARIAALDTRLRVVDLSAPFYPVFPEVLRPDQPPPAPYTGAATREALCREVEVLLGRMMPPGFLQTMPALRWVQAASAGVDLWRGTGLLERTDIALTSGEGINANAVAEWALLAMLYFSKLVPQWLQEKEGRVWQRRKMAELSGKTAGILGLGPVGRQIAHLCHAFGMHVLGLRRNTAEPVACVDELLSPERRDELLQRSDFVMLALPLTSDTRNLIDAAALRQMRPAAVLINVARGEVVAEADLIAALRAGTIAGAGLDVTVQEPLPPESPLWELPNVFLTAHSAGISDRFDDRITDFFISNLRRYLAGEPLVGLVDRARGY